MFQSQKTEPRPGAFEIDAATGTRLAAALWFAPGADDLPDEIDVAIENRGGPLSIVLSPQDCAVHILSDADPRPGQNHPRFRSLAVSTMRRMVLKTAVTSPGAILSIIPYTLILPLVPLLLASEILLPSWGPAGAVKRTVLRVGGNVIDFLGDAARALLLSANIPNHVVWRLRRPSAHEALDAAINR